MKIAVLADIHGNLPALQAILDDLEGFRPDEIIFAGDFTRGPFPNEVVDRLRELNAQMILGNDDLGPLRYMEGKCPDEWRTCQSFGMLRWSASRLTPVNAAFLRSLPETLLLEPPGVEPIQVVHGSPQHVAKKLSPDDLVTLDQALAMIAAPVLICGHSHVQWRLRRHGKLVINPGAAAGTQIGPRAQYARLTWDGAQWQVNLRTLDYNFAALQQAFEQRGLLAEVGPLARAFLLSQETGHDFLMAFLHYAYDLARQSGWPGGPALPDELFQRASDTFCWYL